MPAAARAMRCAESTHAALEVAVVSAAEAAGRGEMRPRGPVDRLAAASARVARAATESGVRGGTA